MDFNNIVQAIGTLGFPIVMCCVIFFYLNAERKDHKEEMNSLKDVLSDTKNVIAELKQLIEDKLNG